MYTDDSQVIGEVLQGRKDRYEELIEKYKRMVYGIAWSHLGNVDLSEDAAQETFIKAYSYLGTLRNPSRFPGWLARIARNVCNSFGRRAKREAALQERWAFETAQPEDAGRESLEEQLQQSFATLPAIHREALTIFYIEDKSLRESAAILGISETALKARLFRARAALRVQLEQRLEDTLESLEPRKDFTRSVLAILPLSPKGAAGGGGLLALLGKLSAGLSFALFMGLSQSALTSGLMYLHFRAEVSNIKDAPENKHIKKNIMRTGTIVIISMAGVMILMPLLMVYWGLSSIFKVLAVLQALATFRMGRRLRVNATPFMIGDVLGWVGMTLSSLAIGFLGAPIETFFLLVILMSIMGYFTHNSRQPRVDADLLLGATGDLSREQLKAFAKFLGGYGFVIDYYFQGDTLALVIPEPRPSFAAQITKRLSSGSRVFVRPDGSCEAYYSDTDLKSAQEIHNMTIDRATAEAGLCGTIQHVLESLRQNDLQGAITVLAPPVDPNVYKRDPKKLRHWHIQYVFTIVFMIGFLAWTRIETGHWFHYIPSENWFDLIKGK